MRITAVSLDSFSESAFLSSFLSLPSASFLSAAGSAGLPSGKAVLNLPVRRIANSRFLPSDLNSFAICSPDNVARKPSTICEASVVWRRTVFFKPSVGEPEKVPAKGIRMLSICAVMTSSLLMPAGLIESTAGDF